MLDILVHRITTVPSLGDMTVKGCSTFGSMSVRFALLVAKAAFARSHPELGHDGQNSKLAIGRAVGAVSLSSTRTTRRSVGASVAAASKCSLCA